MKLPFFAIVGLALPACGQDRPQDPSIPPELRGVTAIAVCIDGGCSCVLQDGRPRCWGAGLSQPPEGLSMVHALGVGADAASALDGSGHLSSWGRFVGGAPEGPLKHVSVGGHQICGVDFEGVAHCWYSEEYLDFLRDTVSPEWEAQTREAYELNSSAIPAGKKFSKIEVFDSYVCALEDPTRELHCWGKLLDDENDEVRRPPPGPMKDFAIGSNFGCGLRMDGEGVCWGGPAAPPVGKFASVFAGWQVACFGDDVGTLSCFGTNSGQLSIGGASSVPSQHFKAVDLSLHACGITMDDRVICWGLNRSGECDVPSDLGERGATVL